jgi:hypothetical protein
MISRTWFIVVLYLRFRSATTVFNRKERKERKDNKKDSIRVKKDSLFLFSFALFAFFAVKKPSEQG